jgi:hypothetical protein
METILEHALSASDWWLNFSAIVVALGILGECVVEVAFDSEMRQDKRKMALTLLFGAIVLSGVLGEYVFGKKVSEISGSLQRIKDQRVAIADANAAQANAEAARANAKAAEAAKQSALSLERTNEAEERAAKEEVEAARLSKAAEGERLARLRDEATSVPRRLSVSDQRMMADELKSFAGLQVFIYYRDEGREPFAFASDIRQVVAHAGWVTAQLEPEATIIVDGPAIPALLHTGVWLTYSTVGPSLPAAQELAQSLTVRGFEVHIERVNPLSAFRDAALLAISVEPRPLGVQGRIGG